jgi:hypothetical protein
MPEIAKAIGTPTAIISSTPAHETCILAMLMTLPIARNEPNPTPIKLTTVLIHRVVDDISYLIA